MDLTVSESSYKEKVRFQIQALRATSPEEVIDLVNNKVIPPPLPGTDVLEAPYFGWTIPIAVRATSGHSDQIRVILVNPQARHSAGGRTRQMPHELLPSVSTLG